MKFPSKYQPWRSRSSRRNDVAFMPSPDGTTHVTHNGLPVVYETEPIKGTKYASLWLNPRTQRVEFRGVGGMGDSYGTEAYAICGYSKKHAVPGQDCTCGFWIPVRKESRLGWWNPDQVQLEVEIAGRIVECGRDPLPAPPWGYRAQWQRVLSVTLSSECAVRGLDPNIPCSGPPVCLVRWTAGNYVYGACLRHTMSRHAVVLDAKPVSRLRRDLRTEIRPGTVTDDDQTASWRDAIREVTGQLCSASILQQAPLPARPRPGELFRICADITHGLVYEMEFTGSPNMHLEGWDADKIGWSIRAIYHPALGPWGWGAPPE